MKVLSVNISKKVHINKASVDEIKIIEDYGVEGDRHAGKTVQHIWDKKKNPEAPNLRQVHLIHAELFQEQYNSNGFEIKSGEMGENVTTEGIDLLALPKNTILHLGKDAQVQIKGLRKPCSQLDGVQKGLLNAMVDLKGEVPYKTGVMAIALKSGIVKPGDEIRVVYPEEPFEKLEAV